MLLQRAMILKAYSVVRAMFLPKCLFFRFGKCCNLTSYYAVDATPGREQSVNTPSIRRKLAIK